MSFQKPIWQCPTCNCTMKLEHRRSHLGSESHNKKLIAAGGSPEFWNCNLCNSTMTLNNKADHLAGRRHTESLKKAKSPPKAKKVKQVKPENSAQSTLWEAEPQADISSKGYPSPLHPNGKKLIKEYDIRDVYDDAYDLPLEAWEGARVKLPNGKNTLVTAAEVQAVREVYESWGVTMPISGGVSLSA